MSARSIVPQLVTKLAIGLGALFLVGVLLAAIPNHHVPTITGVSAERAEDAHGMDHAPAPNTGTDKTISSNKDTAHEHVSAPKAGDSVR